MAHQWALLRMPTGGSVIVSNDQRAPTVTSVRFNPGISVSCSGERAIFIAEPVAAVFVIFEESPVFWCCWVRIQNYAYGHIVLPPGGYQLPVRERLMLSVVFVIPEPKLGGFAGACGI